MDEYLIGILRLISSAQEKTREEDCKAVCDGCAHPESMKVKSAKVWVHYFLDGNGHFICDAAAIRNLAMVVSR